MFEPLKFYCTCQLFRFAAIFFLKIGRDIVIVEFRSVNDAVINFALFYFPDTHAYSGGKKILVLGGREGQ